MTFDTSHPLRVVIAGGGVAGLEAALALRALAGERAAVSMIAPEEEFIYRPLRVLEPFDGPKARHYDLAALTRGIGVELARDAFKSVDTANRRVETESGVELGYDALLLALGARVRPAFEHAVTLDDRQLDDRMQGVVLDVEQGYAHRIAFISPDPSPWPLPMYELALMTAHRAWQMGERVWITIVTPERAPLEVFGTAASSAVGDLLHEMGIATVLGTQCTTPRAGHVRLSNGETLSFDRVIAMPQLVGPLTPGLSKRSADAFIPIDQHCRVPGADGVFAAGDATDFPVRHGGVAAQAADVAASAIAAMAGAGIEPTTLHPLIHGMLLNGKRPLYMSAYLDGEHGPGSPHGPIVGEVGDTPTWEPPEKVAAQYLSPYLDALDRAGV